MSEDKDQPDVSAGQQHYLDARQRAQDKATTFFTGRTPLQQLGSRGAFNQAVFLPPEQQEQAMPDDPNKPEAPKPTQDKIAQAADQTAATPSQSTPNIAGEMPTADHQQAHLKAQQTAASKVSGMHQEPNQLDEEAAVPPFQKAAMPPQPIDQQPKVSLELTPPAPGGQVSPPLRDKSAIDAQKNELKKQMRVKLEFNRSGKDNDNGR